jgi:hypothetical protein
MPADAILAEAVMFRSGADGSITLVMRNAICRFATATPFQISDPKA